MASVVPKKVNKLLECAVCMEQFQEPKILPCLHTYCKGCLENLVKKKGPDCVITCPECRQDAKIADGDVGKLQPNFWVNNFMTFISMQDKTASGKPLPCEHCDSGDPAMSRCTDCNVFICQFCVTAHKRITVTKSHQILSLADVQKLGSKALVHSAFCVKHTGETLKMYCETCQETICRDCTIVDHREHKYSFVADVARRERKVVQDVLYKTKVKERAVVEGLNAVQTMKERVQSKVSEVNKEVDAFFNKQVKALEYYRANIQHEFMAQGQMRVNELEKQSGMLSSFLAELKSVMDFTNQAIADEDDVKLLSLKKQLTQQLAQMNSSKIECKPSQNDYLKLRVHQTVWDMAENMATLRFHPFDAQKCTVSMVGGEEGVIYDSLVGQTVDFMLTIKDENADREIEVGTMVKAQVSCKGNQTEALLVHDLGNGTCRFSYRPKAEGPVTLSVMVGDRDVRGSPFHWQVINFDNHIQEAQLSQQLKQYGRQKLKGSLWQK